MIARIVAAFERSNNTVVLVYDSGVVVVSVIPSECGVYQTATVMPADTPTLPANPLLAQRDAARARRKSDAPCGCDALNVCPAHADV